jgi:hypothetical protein
MVISATAGSSKLNLNMEGPARALLLRGMPRIKPRAIVILVAGFSDTEWLKDEV